MPSISQIPIPNITASGHYTRTAPALTHLLPDYAGGLHGLGDVAGRGRGEVEAVVEVIELVRRAAVHVVRPGRR